MRKVLQIILLLILSVPLTHAQVITFDKTICAIPSAALYDVEQTTDGGYIAIGNTRSRYLSGVAGSMIILKFNQYGDTIWTRAIGSSTWYPNCSIKQTIDGGFIYCGYGKGSLKTAYIAKLNASGHITWEKWYGNGQGYDFFTSAKQNVDGTYTALGSTRKGSTIYAYLVKLNALGDTIWTKKHYQYLSKDYISQELALTSDGGYFITAKVSSNNSDINELVLFKTDSLGNKLWQKLYPEIEGYSGKQTSDGGYIISGSVNASPWDARKICLYKLNPAGDTVWTKQYRGDRANSVIQTSDGGYAFTGSIWADTAIFGPGSGYNYYFQDLLVVKTNGTGQIQYKRIIGDSIDDSGYNIRQTSDGGFIVAGVKDYFFNAGIGYIPLASPDKAILLKIKFTALDAETPIPSGNRISTFDLFPNPASTQTTIKITDDIYTGGPLKVNVLNSIGRIILTKKMSNEVLIIDRKNQASGLYLVQLVDEQSGKVLAIKRLLWQ